MLHIHAEKFKTNQQLKARYDPVVAGFFITAPSATLTTHKHSPIMNEEQNNNTLQLPPRKLRWYNWRCVLLGFILLMVAKLFAHATGVVLSLVFIPYELGVLIVTIVACAVLGKLAITVFTRKKLHA